MLTEGNTGFSSVLSSSASTIMIISESSAVLLCLRVDEDTEDRSGIFSGSMLESWEEEKGATELDILELFRTNSICKVFKFNI